MCVPYTCTLSCSVRSVSHNEFEVKKKKKSFEYLEEQDILPKTARLNLVVFMEG